MNRFCQRFRRGVPSTQQKFLEPKRIGQANSLFNRFRCFFVPFYAKLTVYVCLFGSGCGGAFSGKDTSKVDRSAAYMCRWVAKHIVAAGLAKHCEVQVSYAIGKAEPVSVEVLSDCKALTANELSRRVKDAFSFKPADIIEALGLKPPIFSATTNYGHFGKDELPWEKLDPKKLDKLKS